MAQESNTQALFVGLYREFLTIDIQPTRAATSVLQIKTAQYDLLQVKQDPVSITDQGSCSLVPLINLQNERRKAIDTNEFRNFLTHHAVHHSDLITTETPTPCTYPEFNEEKVSRIAGFCTYTIYRNTSTCVTTEWFGSLHCMSKAFAVSAMEATTEDPSLDFAAMSEFYAALDQVIGRNISCGLELRKMIFQKTTSVFDKLQAQSNHLLHPCQLRYLLVILNAPLKHDFNLLTDCLRCFSMLTVEAREIISTWFKKIVPVNLIAERVQEVQNMLTVILLEKSNLKQNVVALVDAISPQIRHALNFLKLCFEANSYREVMFKKHRTDFYDIACKLANEHNTQGNITLNTLSNFMDYKLFYNESLNNAQTILRHDFRQYVDKVFSGKIQTLTFGLLENSFVLTPATKSILLKSYAVMTQDLEAQMAVVHMLVSPGQLTTNVQTTLTLVVRREHLIEDTVNQLTHRAARAANSAAGDGVFRASDLRKQLRVKFKGEEGYDEGGVTKEFFQLLIFEIFNPDFGMFVLLEDTRLFWFQTFSVAHEQEFELIGIILGLAIYNGVILDLRLPLAVYKKLLDVEPDITDLAELEPQLTLSLCRLMSMTEKEMAMLDLTFSATKNVFGETTEFPISDKISMTEPVTINNRALYIECYVDWYLNKSIESAFTAFYKGFHSAAGTLARTLFRPEELLLVIVGNEEIDFEALEASAQYQDGYTKDSDTIKDFWSVAHELPLESKKKLLMYITGSDRAPIKGLSSLVVTIGRQGSETHLLPTAHTCFNYLLLPDYKDKEKLTKFLQIALENCRGFGLI